MLYSIGALIVIVGMAALLVYLRFTRRRSPPLFMILATLPVLAGGAASGQWAAVASMIVVVVAVPTFQWADARWPAEPPPDRRPG